MKSTLRWMFTFVALVAATQSFATMKAGTELIQVPGQDFRSRTTLDEQCTITYISHTYGTWSGYMDWPGGFGEYYLSGYAFLNSCTPGETLYTYCVDLDHLLNMQQYCANIDSVVVRPDPYAEQYPAMAYVMTWYPVSSALDDRIMQLMIWKLSNDERTSSSTYGDPWYFIDDGRDPGFPYVNTVWNSDTTINNPGNRRVKDALGFGSDSLAKNVAMCGDLLTLSAGETAFSGDSAFVPLTLQLTRGAAALAVNNTSVSGVKIKLTVVDGVLNTNEVFTDTDGKAEVVVSKDKGSPVGAVVQACTYGLWPRKITPCEGLSQQLLVQAQTTGALCTLCVRLPIMTDQWLAAELASFDAVPGTEGVRLSWRSSSETNADHWEIERRMSGNGNYHLLTSLRAVNLISGGSYGYEDRTVEEGIQYDYRLATVTQNGDRTVHGSWIRTAGLSASEEMPQTYELADNFPNPFNPETRIRFSLPAAGNVSLKVYDATGKEVAVLAAGEMSAGSHVIAFNAEHLPSGLYFYTMSSGSFSQTKKMILMK